MWHWIWIKIKQIKKQIQMNPDPELTQVVTRLNSVFDVNCSS